MCRGQIVFYLPEAFDFAPWLFYVCVLYGITMSGVEPIGMILMAIFLSAIVFYRKRIVHLKGLFWPALFIFFFYALFPADMILNIGLVAAMCAYSIVKYVPMEYLAVLMSVIVLGSYFAFIAYLTFTTMTSAGNGVVLAFIFLTWNVIMGRPRIVEE